jgi:hypothetical protein
MIILGYLPGKQRPPSTSDACPCQHRSLSGLLPFSKVNCVIDGAEYLGKSDLYNVVRHCLPLAALMLHRNVSSRVGYLWRTPLREPIPPNEQQLHLQVRHMPQSLLTSRLYMSSFSSFRVSSLTQWSNA